MRKRNIIKLGDEIAVALFNKSRRRIIHSETSSRTYSIVCTCYGMRHVLDELYRNKWDSSNFEVRIHNKTRRWKSVYNMKGRQI